MCLTIFQKGCYSIKILYQCTCIMHTQTYTRYTLVNNCCYHSWSSDLIWLSSCCAVRNSFFSPENDLNLILPFFSIFLIFSPVQCWHLHFILNHFVNHFLKIKKTLPSQIRSVWCYYPSLIYHSVYTTAEINGNTITVHLHRNI